MTHSRLFCGLALAVFSLLVSGRANALGTADHRDVTSDACTEAGLSWSFCERASIAAYNVDALEFSAPEAHSMSAVGQGLCEAADATADRLGELGSDFDAELEAMAADGSSYHAAALADTLGRAMHTIQDNCAHQGQADPEHAWASRSDLCLSTDLSPDVQDGALGCAEQQSDLVMTAVASTVAARGVERLLDGACPDTYIDDRTGQNPCGSFQTPRMREACTFLRTASSWDGRDVRWEVARVAPILAAAFIDAATGAGTSAESVCARGDIGSAFPAPPTDLSTIPDCGAIDLICIGSADAAGDTDQLLDQVFGSETSRGDADAMAGCSAAGAGAGGCDGLAAVLIALALLGVRQRSSVSGAPRRAR
jgi:hypothetical protein